MPRTFEPAADDVLASAFHDARSDWQSALPVEVAANSVRVDLVVTDADHDVFGPLAVRLQSRDELNSSPSAGPRPRAAVGPKTRKDNSRVLAGPHTTILKHSVYASKKPATLRVR